MATTENSKRSAPRPWTVRRVLGIVGNLLACFAVLAGAALAIKWINDTEPSAQQVNATRKSAAIVETVVVTRGTHAPKLAVLGTVRPAQEIVLSPQVSGRVVELSDKFVPGGMVLQGDLLLKLDPADFENAVSIRKSELEKANASLQIEKARQELAEKELALLEGSIDNANRGLVLREPQIASIRADLSAAQASLERAQLDLERTRVVAPFDAQILTRSVNVGSQVGSGDELAQLVGVQQYWVIAAIPVRNLRWLDFPEEQNSGGAGNGSRPKAGATVRLRDSDSWPEDTIRKGRLARMIGTLDQQTRLARLLVTVEDPLGMESQAPPLILNSLIEVEIEGRPIENVVRLNRAWVRDGETVWVMKENQLEIRDTEIVFRDADFAYIRKGLENGEEVVTSTLATVANGVGLKKAETSVASEDLETTP
ncbi:MAG: efflux RND transporter periplasmic adaptor subunit [Planctomycetota bacterium]